MKRITFVNHGHAGDMVHPREFIKQIIRDLPDVKFDYLSFNDPKTYLDLDIQYSGPPEEIHRNTRFIKDDPNHLYINVLINAYSKHFNPLGPEPFYYFGGTNYVALHYMWDHIFKNINEFFGSELTLLPKEQYLPTIDYAVFQIDNAAKFLNTRRYRKKILICNGKVRSKQSFKHNMAEVIIRLAQDFPYYDFYCTAIFKHQCDNIFFTDDIIGIDESDLNEISFMSEHCDVIVGKNSGPFVYCVTKKNVFERPITFISFDNGSHDPTVNCNTHVDNLTWGLIGTMAQYINSNLYSDENMLAIIKSVLTND